MKQSQKIVLYTATLITAKSVIPAPAFTGVNLSPRRRGAGIQTTFLRRQETITQESGFPRIKYGAAPYPVRGNPGMTNYIRLISSCIALTFIISCILFGTTLIEPTKAHGQSKEKTGLHQEKKLTSVWGRDPFLLPPGVHLLSKIDAALGIKEMVSTEMVSTPEGKPVELSPPLTVKAILISPHIRLALIDRHIVTVGDSIDDEKILEIKTDGVILAKGDKKRTLLLSQSPVQLTVEEK